MNITNASRDKLTDWIGGNGGRAQFKKATRTFHRSAARKLEPEIVLNMKCRVDYKSPPPPPNVAPNGGGSTQFTSIVLSEGDSLLWHITDLICSS